MFKPNSLIALTLVVFSAACGGVAEKQTSTIESTETVKSKDVCWYLVDGCKYSVPMLGEGTRELSCAATLDYTKVIDVVCGEAALPPCHSAETCE